MVEIQRLAAGRNDTILGSLDVVSMGQVPIDGIPRIVFSYLRNLPSTLTASVYADFMRVEKSYIDS
jgi:hypothetical protein